MPMLALSPFYAGLRLITKTVADDRLFFIVGNSQRWTTGYPFELIVDFWHNGWEFTGYIEWEVGPRAPSIQLEWNQLANGGYGFNGQMFTFQQKDSAGTWHTVKVLETYTGLHTVGIDLNPALTKNMRVFVDGSGDGATFALNQFKVSYMG